MSKLLTMGEMSSDHDDKRWMRLLSVCCMGSLNPYPRPPLAC